MDAASPLQGIMVRNALREAALLMFSLIAASSNPTVIPRCLDDAAAAESQLWKSVNNIDTLFFATPLLSVVVRLTVTFLQRTCERFTAEEQYSYQRLDFACYAIDW